MNLWSTREQSLHWLDKELHQERRILQDGFEFLLQLVERFQKLGFSEGENQVGEFSRVCTVTLAKYNHLLLGCYSLTLDGLAQEAGALLRPLIETYELLVYFRQDVSRVEEIHENRLPSAGEIGKRIAGNYKDLRKHLSESASHFNYKTESVRHLFDGNAEVNAMPRHGIATFRTNLNVLSAFQAFALIESVNCLNAVGFDGAELADEIEAWRKACVKVFATET
jgi:hypothetical protein